MGKYDGKTLVQLKAEWKTAKGPGKNVLKAVAKLGTMEAACFIFDCVFLQYGARNAQSVIDVLHSMGEIAAPLLADLAVRVGALDPGDRTVNGEASDLLVTQERAPFVPVAGWFAALFTWWTVIVELVIAVCFALPRRSRLAIVGDLALLLFLATTYTVVPVLGFAAILGTLGLAQSRHHWISALYVLGLVGLPLQEAVARLI